MNKICVAELAAKVTLVYDGQRHREFPNRGNFLGLYYIIPKGGWEWMAENGDHGECGGEEEAMKEIQEAWAR